MDKTSVSVIRIGIITSTSVYEGLILPYLISGADRKEDPPIYVGIPLVKDAEREPVLLGSDISEIIGSVSPELLAQGQYRESRIECIADNLEEIKRAYQAGFYLDKIPFYISENGERINKKRVYALDLHCANKQDKSITRKRVSLTVEAGKISVDLSDLGLARIEKDAHWISRNRKTPYLREASNTCSVNFSSIEFAARKLTEALVGLAKLHHIEFL